MNSVSSEGVLRYPGGKYFARKMLVAAFPPLIDEYREPLLGGGSVYLAARRAGVAKSYWINDIHDPLMSFWMTTQDSDMNQELRSALYRWLHKRTDSKTAKRIWIFLRKKRPTSTFAKAVRFFILNRFSYSGTTESGGCSSSAPFDRFTPSVIERLRTLVPLLSKTKITCSSYESLLDCSESDFLFLDPPYGSSSKLYGVNGDLHEFDLPRFSHALRNVRGRFLLTLNDSPSIRELFSWSNIQPFQMRYGMNNCGKESKSSKRGSEILIANYEIPFDSPREQCQIQ